ncbi:MAG: L-2-hydroxyglutarate oxidase, partial [Alphaproteobacteria bacterium]
MQVDYLVIGGGIVGLSSAMQILQAKPGATLLLLEKEDGVARHQTGRNSGVIHAGVYYQPGSLKAEYCRIGAAAMMTFCGEHAIPFEQCGKLIVATDALELARMGALEERCTLNQIKIERLDAQELRNREPNIIGNGALYVPSSGIVDYGLVARVMAQEVERLGGVLTFNAKIRRITEGANTVAVETDRETYQVKSLVVCGGLHADALAHMAGLETDWTMVPFRGEYFKLPDAKADIVKHLIYPVPNPDLPFLGVHLTKLAGGGQTLGPNAMLAFGREAYRKTDFNAADVAGFA